MVVIIGVPVVESAVLAQGQFRILQSLGVILHLEVDTGQESVGCTQVRMYHRHGLLGKTSVDGFLHTADDEVIHLLYGHLLAWSIYHRTGNEGHAQFLSCCSGLVGVGIVVDQYIVAEGTDDLGVCYHLRTLGISSLGRSGDVFNYKVAGRNSGVHPIICTLIRVVQHDTVGRLIPHVVGPGKGGTVEIGDGHIVVIQQIKGVADGSLSDGVLVTQQ